MPQFLAPVANAFLQIVCMQLSSISLICSGWLLARRNCPKRNGKEFVAAGRKFARLHGVQNLLSIFDRTRNIYQGPCP